MNYFRLFKLTLKQSIKRPIMICIMLIMILLCVFIAGDQLHEDDKGITILYCIDYSDVSSDSYELFPIEDSLEHYDGIYNFVKVDDASELNDMILRKEADCGYIIPANISELVFKRHSKDTITVIVNPSSTLDPIVNETIFSLIFPNVSSMALDKYLKDKSALHRLYGRAFDASDVFALYEENATDGSTFTFNYIGQPTNYRQTTSTIITSPLRGLLSLFVVLAGFIGALAFYKEAKNPVFSLPVLRLIYIFVPCLLTGLVSLFGNILTHKNDASFSVISEVIAILALICISTIYVFILSIIVRSELLFASLIPIFTIAALVFTPIFINIGSFVPILKPVSYLLPNYYYLIL